jgi:hypothetical protein
MEARLPHTGKSELGRWITTTADSLEQAKADLAEIEMPPIPPPGIAGVDHRELRLGQAYDDLVVDHFDAEEV